MKFYTVFLCVLCLTVTISCSVRNNQSAASGQGIEGKITLREGNFMPGPGSKQPEAKGVKRKLFIYAVATAAQATGQAPLFTAVQTRLVTTTESDASGVYKCKLPAGKYSVFTAEENNQLFSSLSNEKGELSPVEVQPGKFSVLNIAVDYKAVY